MLALFAAVGLFIATGGFAVAPGYVSESGVAGTPHSELYRLSVLAVAGAAGLLAWLLRPTVWSAAALLGAATPLVALSAAVSCTSGCPLPPYEPTTPADLWHAGASGAGVACCALAMLQLARLARPGRLRLAARIAMAVAWPPLGATAILILALGRGPVTGQVERFALAACVVWLITTAALLTTPALGRAPSYTQSDKKVPFLTPGAKR